MGACDDGDDHCGQSRNLKDARGPVASAELSSLTQGGRGEGGGAGTFLECLEPAAEPPPPGRPAPPSVSPSRGSSSFLPHPQSLMATQTSDFCSLSPERGPGAHDPAASLCSEVSLVVVLQFPGPAGVGWGGWVSSLLALGSARCLAAAAAAFLGHLSPAVRLSRTRPSSGPQLPWGM